MGHGIDATPKLPSLQRLAVLHSSTSPRLLGIRYIHAACRTLCCFGPDRVLGAAGYGKHANHGD